MQNALNQHGRYCMYLRRSRADADAERMGAGETLARHLRMLQELAGRLIGHPIPDTAIYREIVSGDTIADRPEMQRLLGDVEKRRWDGVLVADIDRLARGDTMDQGLLAQTFLYSETLIVTPMKIYDPSDPADSEFFETRLFFARREYQMITRRMQAGRANATMEGCYVASRPPYGYDRYKLPDRRGWSLSINDQQAAVVRMIYDWYLHGLDGRQVGGKLIAMQLNSMGLKTARGADWQECTVVHILKNPVYTGKVKWYTRKQQIQMQSGQKIKKRVHTDDAILVRGLHQPIISQEVFDQAQRKLVSSRPAPVPGNRTCSNALAGLVKCGHCGRAMRYFCPSSRPRKHALMKCSNSNDCGCHAIYYDLVLSSVMDTLKVWATYDQRPLPAPAEADPHAAMRAAQEKQLATLNTQLSRLRDLLEQGVYTVDVYLERERDIQARISACQSSLGQLAPPEKTRDQLMAELAPRVRIALDAFPAASPAEQNTLLKSVISRITYLKPCKTPPGHNPLEYLTLDISPNLPK